MDYLQYINAALVSLSSSVSFKPCYKWITFNTYIPTVSRPFNTVVVLNLVINGLPSIHNGTYKMSSITDVLNLVINGLPSIHSLIVFLVHFLLQF